MRAPMSEGVMARVRSLGASHGARAGHDALDDVVIPGAAGQIAFQALSHFVLGRARVALGEVERVHPQAGSEKAALQAMVLLEAACMGCKVPSGWATASIVRISAPSACIATIEQLLIALP